MRCLFCCIVAGEILVDKLLDTAEFLACHYGNTPDRKHIIIFHRRHISRVTAHVPADSDLVGKILFAAKDLADCYGLTTRGFQMVFNSGTSDGKAVVHMHLHLLSGRTVEGPTHGEATPNELPVADKPLTFLNMAGRDGAVPMGKSGPGRGRSSRDCLPPNTRGATGLNLTDREFEILTLFGKGFTAKSTAGLLQLSYETVRTHQKNIYRKLQVRSAIEAVATLNQGRGYGSGEQWNSEPT